MGNAGSSSGRPMGPRRCGHDPAAPVLEPAWSSSSSHPFLQRAIERVRESVYYGRRSSHPRLLLRRRGRDSKRRGTRAQVYSVSRKRSDRSEAQARLLIFAIARCNLPSLQVGDWQRGNAPFDLDALARGLGLTRWRLDRAISDLRAAQYIHRWQGRDHERVGGEARWAGHVAILKLTTICFRELGIAEELALLRRRDEKERRRAEHERAAGDRAAGERLFEGGLGEMLEPMVQDLRSPAPPNVIEADLPAFNSLCLAVDREHRDWTEAEVRAEALRRLYPDGPPPRR